MRGVIVPASIPCVTRRFCARAHPHARALARLGEHRRGVVHKRGRRHHGRTSGPAPHRSRGRDLRQVWGDRDDPSDDLDDVHRTTRQGLHRDRRAARRAGDRAPCHHPELAHPLEALLFGLAIVGAAFLLSWAAEVAQLDISAGLAIALLALIAVLPEYAVDFVFAWKAGKSFARPARRACRSDGGTESPCSLALANMTGANRLLIGIGWSMVVFVACYRLRATKGRLVKAAALGRREARPRALGRDRVPRRRDDLLAHPAAEAHDHAVRRRRPDRDLRALHHPRLARARRGTAPRRPGPLLGTFCDTARRARR